MKIVDSKLQGNVLQEFTAKYLEEHKDLIKYVKEETEKQLLLHNVSQQRELLLGFQKSEWFDLYEQGVLEYKDAIDKYLA